MGTQEDSIRNWKWKTDDTVLTWLVLPDVLEMGKAADDFFQEAKRKGQLPNRGTKQKKRRPEERLRMADPW